jgi:tetratricopeptide (TPR) repeat protein
MRHSSWLLASILTSFFLIFGLAQTPQRPDNSGARSHVIRGKLFLPNGRMPEQRIRVVLEVSSGGIYADAFSDSVGNFEFRSLATNNYRIVVPSDGFTFESAQENVEVSGPISRTYNVQIYLREKVSNTNSTKDKMISAAEFTQDVPKAAKKSFEQGLKKMKDGKPGEAEQQFQDALKTFPEYVLALNKLGEAYIAQEKFPEAQQEFEKAISISSKYPVAYINLGILMTRLKRYDAAIESLDSALRLNESFPMAHLYLGVAWLEKTPQDAGNLDKAEKSFNKALALGGNEMANAHKYIFNIYIRRKQMDKAAAALEAYLEAMPNAPDAPAVKQMLEKVKARNSSDHSKK